MGSHFNIRGMITFVFSSHNIQLKVLLHKTFICQQSKSELDFQYNTIEMSKVQSFAQFLPPCSKKRVSFLLQSTINLTPILGLRQWSTFCNKGSFSLFIHLCIQCSVKSTEMCLVNRAQLSICMYISELSVSYPGITYYYYYIIIIVIWINKKQPFQFSGPFCSCQYIFIAQISLHILSESSSGTTTSKI